MPKRQRNDWGMGAPSNRVEPPLETAKNAIVNELRFSYLLAPVRPFGRSGGHPAKWIIEKQLTQEEPNEVE